MQKLIDFVCQLCGEVKEDWDDKPCLCPKCFENGDPVHMDPIPWKNNGQRFKFRDAE